MKKLLALLLATMMLLSLFACDGTGKETEAPSQSETESETDAPSQSETESNVKETEEKTEAPTQKETEAPTQSESDVPTQSESESAKATESESAKATESESANATESESANVTESESANVTESESANATESESAKATESEPANVTESESVSDKGTESETESEKVSESETEPEGDEDVLKDGETVRDPASLLSDVDYYFAVEQDELGKTLYLNGKMDGYYPASTSDISEAVRVRLEWSEGRYYVYFIENGTKYYINSTVQGKLVRLTFDTERNTIFSFDRETATLMFAVGDNAYFIGMYDDLAYFSASKADYASESYLTRLVVAECSHPYIADADGHTLLKCGRCGTAEGEKQAHDEALSVKYGERYRMFYCATCSYIVKTEVCDGNHYLSDKDGHWEGACEICQTPEGKKTPHSDVNAEFIVGNTYSCGCSVCAHAYYEKDISGVTQLITPYMWGITATTYYQVNNGKSYGQFVFEDGSIPYGRITGGKETVVDGVSTPIIGQLLYNRSYSDTANTSPNQQYTWDVGNADYLIIKMRTNDNTQVVSFSFSTTGKDGMASGKSLPLSSLKNDEWGVIAIDLKSYFGEYYAKDANLDTYLVDSFYFTFTPTMASSTYIDVAYMAFLEGGYEEMDVVVDEEEVVLMTASATVNLNIASGSCTGDHSYETKKLDGYYVGVCPACGDKKEYGVSEDALYFASPDYITTSVGMQGTHDKTVKTENGVRFVRVDNFKAPGGWGSINLMDGEYGVTGQYLVMKVRIGENGNNQSYLKIYCSTKKANLTEDGGVAVKVSEDNEWHTIVVDLSTRVKAPDLSFIKDDDGYHVRYVQIRPFSNYQTIADATDYMDIAYIAICDSLDDLKGVVVDDVYELSVSTGASEVRKTADNSCAVHSFGSLEQETKDGLTVYSSVCAVCSVKIYEKVVPASVSAYYTGQSMVNDAKTYHLGSKGETGFDPVTGAVCGKELGNRQIIWYRAQRDCPYNMRASENDTANIGNARFLVLRAKTNDLERTLSIAYSTKGKNAPTTVAEVDDPFGEVRCFDVTGKEGIKAGDTYATDIGWKSIKIPMADAAGKDEWATYVIDLAAVVGDYHSKAEGEDSYVVDTLIFDIIGGTGNLSFEYMAFVEGDWSDVADLTGEGSVVNITSVSGAFEMKDLTTGN